MSAAIRFLLLVVALAVASCGPAATGREETRVRQEVERRVEIIRDDLKTAESIWHTIRVSAFCILAGGCLIWLLGGHGGTSSAQSGRPRLPDRKSSEQAPGCRIIDRDYDPYDHEREDDSYHR